MIIEMDRAWFHRLFVGGGVKHYIAAHHQIHFFAREHSLQFLQICIVCNIHRNIVREQIYIFFVGYRHHNNLPPCHARLRFLGPGKFVQSQIHLKAQIADFLYNAFVTG